MIEDLKTNLAQFNNEVDSFVKSIPEKYIVPFQKKLVLEALRRLVMKTPVDTGRARGNWQVTIADPAEVIINKSEWDERAKEKRDRKTNIPPLSSDDSEVIKKGISAIANLPPYHIVWISNNVDYIEFLEDGSSTQAPEGMLSLTIAELNVMFSSGLEAIEKGTKND